MTVYPLVDGPLMPALEHSSSVQQEVSDEVGEAYLLLAEVLLAAAVPNESIIVVPLNPPEVGEVLNFSYVARRKVMFVQLHEKPKQFMTFELCLGYSTGTVDPPLAIKEGIHF
jgi:hypothetical protein